MKILFCHLRTHGDIIRTFPLIDAVKKLDPAIYIGYTCFIDMVDVCQLCSSIDEIIPQPKLEPPKDFNGGTRILDCSKLQLVSNIIKKRCFDIYVDLQGVFQSGLIGCLGNILRRVGRGMESTKDGAHLFYTDIQKELSTNKMERHFDVMRIVFPNIKPLSYDMEWKKRNIISIFPGSSKLGILKRWDIMCYRELSEMIPSVYEVRIILGPEEKNLSEELCDRSTIKIVNISSWREAYEIINESRIVVGNDSAYLHLAIWRHVPSIMISGATQPDVNGVWRYGIGENIYSQEKCIRCDVWKGICDKNHKCMDAISVNDVYDSIKKYM